MFKRLIFLCVVFILVYVFVVKKKVEQGVVDLKKEPIVVEKIEEKKELYKIQNFSFTKYNDEGSKELEIQGDSADMLAEVVSLENVISKAYTEDVPVTVTADLGKFDRDRSVISLEKNVVATTDDGARLLTETLQIETEINLVTTKDFAEVFKEDMKLKGVGARADEQLKEVQFFKEVVVSFNEDGNRIEIKCDGPLHLKYNDNIAIFYNNVVATDVNGELRADRMEAFYNRESEEVDKILAMGNVVIEQGSNETFSDQVIYLAKEGRVILEGDPEAFGMVRSKDISGTDSSIPVSSQDEKLDENEEAALEATTGE